MRDTLFQLIKKHQQLCRFIIAGGSALVVNLIALYALTDLLRLYYLVSTVLAFLIAFCVSFVLQKFWTFKDHSRDKLHHQLPLYMAMQGVNLALNASLMYVFVEYLYIWYILSQIIISLGIAFMSFFINRRYIFKTPSALR